LLARYSRILGSFPNPRFLAAVLRGPWFLDQTPTFSVLVGIREGWVCSRDLKWHSNLEDSSLSLVILQRLASALAKATLVDLRI
jgi:hypothetical protein